LTTARALEHLDLSDQLPRCAVWWLLGRSGLRARGRQTGVGRHLRLAQDPSFISKLANLFGLLDDRDGITRAGLAVQPE